MSYTSWVFTINNYTDIDKSECETLKKGCNTFYASLEVGEQGTPHIQGYFTLKRSQRISWLKQMLTRAHFEKAKGNKHQNYEYVFKQGSEKFIDHGSSNQGHRSDLEEAGEIMRLEGERAAAEQYPSTYIRYHRGLNAYASVLSQSRSPDNPPTVYWIYGPTGLGKTRIVYDYFEHSSIYMWNNTDKWFDGYKQQEVLLLDELRSENVNYANLLSLCDRYPKQLPVKGGFVKLNSPFIIITSALRPEECFPMLHDNDSIDQLLRRIKKIIDIRDTSIHTNPFY